MSDILTLSHSQVETWQQCPRRWQLAKIQRVKQAPAEALIFGDAIHQTIEADGKAAVAGTQRLSLPQLVATFSEALATRLAEDDSYHLLVFRATGMRLRGLALLRAYHEQFQAGYQPSEVEAAFPDVEIPPARDGGPIVRFTGRIDARCGEAGETIVDFKTASKPWPAGIEHEKPQATAYLMADRWAGREHTPPARQVRFVVFSTSPWERRGEVGYDAQVDVRTTTREPRERGEYVGMLRTTATLMEQAKVRGVFPARTGPLCGWCGCLGSCGEGQAWLRSRGRSAAVPLVEGTTGAPLVWSEVRE